MARLHNTDELLMSLGKYSKWQVITYCFVAYGSMTVWSWQTLLNVFVQAEMFHHCEVPEGANASEWIPLDSETKSFSECLIYNNNSGSPDWNKTMKCSGKWHYGKERGITVVSEWNLVCDDEWVNPTIQVIFGIGIFIGAPIASFLSDKLGRKPVWLAASWSLLLCSYGATLTTSPVAFAIMRFMSGFVGVGAILVGMVKAVELFPAEQRVFAGVMMQLFWVFGTVVMSGLAYLVDNWRHYQIVLTSLQTVTIVFYWLVPESITWLVVNGFHQKAREIYLKAAKFNNIEVSSLDLKQSLQSITDEIDNFVEQNESNSGHFLHRHSRIHEPNHEPENYFIHCVKKTFSCRKQHAFYTINGDAYDYTSSNHVMPSKDDPDQVYGQTTTDKLQVPLNKRNSLRSNTEDEEKTVVEYTIKDLIKSRKILRNCLIICFIWFVNNTLYFGLSYGSTSLVPGQPNLTFLINGLVELPPYISFIWIMDWFGRRKPLIVSHVGVSVALGTMIILKGLIKDVSTGWLTLFYMLGKMLITSSFTVITLYTPELYPTNFRSNGVGLGILSGRLGGTVLSPFFTYVQKRAWWVPSAFAVTVSLIAALLTLLLPETNRRPLANTIEEIEAWDSKPKKNDNSQAQSDTTNV